MYIWVVVQVRGLGKVGTTLCLLLEREEFGWWSFGDGGLFMLDVDEGERGSEVVGLRTSSIWLMFSFFSSS